MVKKRNTITPFGMGNDHLFRRTLYLNFTFIRPTRYLYLIGRASCVGKELVTTLLKLVILALIVKRFRIRFIPGGGWE